MTGPRTPPVSPAAPPDTAAWVRDIPGGAAVRLKVVPRAREDRWAGRHGDALKVSLRAPPADDRANRALLAFLAAALGCPPSRLEIRSGRASRLKTVVVWGLHADDVARRLAPADEGAGRVRRGAGGRRMALNVRGCPA